MSAGVCTRRRGKAPPRHGGPADGRSLTQQIAENLFMNPGTPVSLLTPVHVILGLLGIASGLVVLVGLWQNTLTSRWTAIVHRAAQMPQADLAPAH